LLDLADERFDRLKDSINDAPSYGAHLVVD
jgi:hypothetical protein